MTAPDKVLQAPGLACIDLTPLIAQTMRELRPGDVLEIHTDDPAARVGVPAWCRLTRNTLLATSPINPDAIHQSTFHIAKKETP